MSWSVSPRLKRNLIMTGLVAALVSGLCIGLTSLESHVHTMPRYAEVLALEWDNLPDWLRLRENRHILKTLTRRVNLKRSDHRLDPQLAERLGTTLLDPGLGWVKSVNRVMVRPDGRVSMRCQFRRPAAWIQYDRYCYLVAAESVRLPGRYDFNECINSSLLMISGVDSRPPAVGQVWSGADLNSGLKLASLISERPFRNQVDRIIVANHDGRKERNRPHIELATDRRGSRIWWGRPPEEEYGIEITANQKLTLMETLFRQWGRIDLNRAYVDVRTHPDSVVLPAQMSSGT